MAEIEKRMFENLMAKLDAERQQRWELFLQRLNQHRRTVRRANLNNKKGNANG